MYDYDGNVIQDPNKACDFLCEYWGKQFENTDIDEVAARQLVGDFSKPFPDTTWMISFDLFCKIISKLGHSAAGPDGIPYSAWLAHSTLTEVLFECYSFWMDSGYLPDDFNVAYLWLLPKGSPENGVFAGKDTRPLSGANSDAKILATALRTPIDERIDGWATEAQRGFIKDRWMLANVFEVGSTASFLFLRLLSCFLILRRRSRPSAASLFGLPWLVLASLKKSLLLCRPCIAIMITTSALMVSSSMLSVPTLVCDRAVP